MNLYILEQYQFIQNLYKNEDYLDILMNIDDFFDILSVYVFPNWFEAEVVEMKCLKHFTNIVLKQPVEKMPHPKAGVELSKYNCIVKYKKTFEHLPKEVKSEDDLTINKKTGKKCAKIEKRQIWLVDILIPNKLIINDNIYDLQTIQQKLENDDEQSDDLESVVNNNEDMAIDNQG